MARAVPLFPVYVRVGLKVDLPTGLIGFAWKFSHANVQGSFLMLTTKLQSCNDGKNWLKST